MIRWLTICWLMLAVVCSCGLCDGSPAWATVIPLENTLTSWAYTGQSGGVEQKLVRTNVVSPFSQDDMATAGDTISMTTYDFTADAAGASLEFAFDHSRDDSLQSFSISDAVVDFQVSQNMPFRVEGRYEFSGAEQKFVQVRLFKNLFGPVNPVFDWTQSSLTDLDGSFDYADEGQLMPGNSYRLQYRFMIASVNGVAEAQAAGSLKFIIGEVGTSGTAGDTNTDGRVDIDDLNHVRNNFGASGDSDGSLAGDAFPFNGTVDIDDLNSVRNNFGTVAAAVPEPSSMLLLALTVAVAYLTPCAARCRT